MKNRIFLTTVFALGMLVFMGCNPQRHMAGNYTFKTECMGVELDGSQTVKAWGDGRNRADAIEQAKKNAVRDVLFSGISNGKSDCNIKPVIFEVNAQEKYETYFNTFFTDDGGYKAFVSEKDGSRYHIEVIKERKQAGSQEKYGVVVRVLRADLVTKMKTDGILK